MNKIKPSNRRKAREFIIQALYQRQLTHDTEAILKEQFMSKFNPKKVDLEYFSDILQGVINNTETIDEILVPVLDRKLKNLNLVENAVLHMATYELVYRQDVPPKVIINEALELTKTFGSIDGYKYVNGVLDTLAKKMRN